jgi:nitrous-oxide reductase
MKKLSNQLPNLLLGAMASLLLLLSSCGQANKGTATGALSGNAAQKTYVAPGSLDEFYLFASGGFSGQIGVYGLPSGRLFKQIPVFSVDAEKSYGFNEETKPMLQTSHGFVPWDDAHHPALSQTNGETDGRWIFINGNNTPRVARVDLSTFETAEILEIPNSAGNHSSPYLTMNTEYLVAGTRFSVPIPQKDVPISSYKENFNGALSFIKVDPQTGHMNVEFQVLMPGLDFDLATCGKGPSHGWSFFTSYNSEQKNSLLEVNASQNDKDFVAAINWKKAEEYLKAGKAKDFPATYLHNVYNDETHTASSTAMKSVKVLIPSDCPGLVYLLPTPKSPHGVDVDPSGKYIACSGKLSADITVHSFEKMLKAIDNKEFDGDVAGVPILKFESVLGGTVKEPGLGPLHTEFDDKGFAYTSFFISSEIVKWKVGTWEVVDRQPTFYSIGHLCVPGGNSMKPEGKYVIALNKITKDRYLPTGPELTQSAQLYAIDGDKMELLLDFPTIGEPHYAQAISASRVIPKQKQFFKLSENKHPYVAPTEKDTKVVREGNNVHVYMTMIRSHFAPDNIEGIKVGDKVFFHVTNLEQDFDVPHGFAVMGANTAEILVMPGQTETLVWEPKQEGVIPFYCTDFCSALHQEMQGYARVSAAGSNTAMKWWLGDEKPVQ